MNTALILVKIVYALTIEPAVTHAKEAQAVAVQTCKAQDGYQSQEGCE